MLEVSRSINSVDFHTVYKSEVALKTKDPRWVSEQVLLVK